MQERHQRKDNGIWQVGDNMKIILKENTHLKGRIRAIIRDAKTGKITRIIPWNNNLITLVGKTADLRNFGNVGAASNRGTVTYGAVGNGNITPLNTDTIMENEIKRKLIATKSVTNQVLTLETFFAEADANDTLTKFALFGEDASGSADSGTMFEYADFQSSFTKTSNETVTVEVQITAS